MSRLQDNQYMRSFVKKESKKESKEETHGVDKLKSLFCPPLDTQLVEDIWTDSHNYNICFELLASIAKEAETQQALEEWTLTETEDDRDDMQQSTSHMHQDSSDTEQSYSDIDQNNSDIDQNNSDIDQNSEVDNIQFLSTCFPGLSPAYLKNTLQLLNNDIEKATDVLLNKTFIDGDDESDIMEEKVQENEFQFRKKKQSKKKMLWASGRLPEGNRNETFNELATVPFNYWHQYDVSVRDIQRYFPQLTESAVANYVQRCRGNVTASVKTIMESIPDAKPEHELPWKQTKNLETLEQQLNMIMVDRSSEEIHRVSVGTLIEYDGQNKDVDQLVNAAVEFMLTYNMTQLALEERLNNMAQQSEEIRRRVKAKSIPVIPEYLHMRNGKDYVEDDPNDCRDIAMQYIMKRNELFHKAAESYRRSKNKGPGAGGVAFYYSDSAREFDTKAKEWNIRAARAAVRKQRITKNDDHLLDLHGLTVAEAKVVMKEGLTQWWSRSITQSSHKQIQPLKIITGVGNHSHGGEARLLPSAIKLLKEGNWLYEMHNPGMINVKGVSIEDGRNFPERSERDVYITSRLNLKLPRPVDDLIPPNTRISTRPSVATQNPIWRTTLVYYVSKQILARLKKRQAEITLEVYMVTEECEVETIGCTVLKVDMAKLVLMNHGDKELSQIQQFVVDKGDWHQTTEQGRMEIKAGLFIVEMPHSMDARDKATATPLQMPMKTNHLTQSPGDLGLEIRSDISDLLMLPEEDDSYLVEEDEEEDVEEGEEDGEEEEHSIDYFRQSHTDYRQQYRIEDYSTEIDVNEENINENGVYYQVASGTDHYKVIFRVISAQNISTLVDGYRDIVRVFFRCVFGPKQYEWDAHMQRDQWIAKENIVTLNLQGHVRDIIDWVNEEWNPRVQLLIERTRGVEMIAYSEIQLTDPVIAKNHQCNVIYDTNKEWYINADNRFAQLESQFGLIKGWKEGVLIRPILYSG